MADALDPTIFVLFGATGDLAKRMVIPAFASLWQAGLLPDEWLLIGNGRKDQTHEWFQDHVKQILQDSDAYEFDEGRWPDLASHLRFAGNGFTTDAPGDLPDVVAAAQKELGESAQLVHYIALPPESFIPYTEALEKHGLHDPAKVVYEKPFGTSPDGFEELEKVVARVFDEDAVYRIDHFLGKEATQDLHVLRFTNRLFEKVWSNESVEMVQIDVPETLDIDDRADFYDATGATLDMVVTHLFQVAAEIAMEPPVSMTPAELLESREAIISAFRPLDPNEVVLGQYDGYLDVEGIPADSTTDTFIAARLWIDTDRWHGVPFLLRTGKRLAASEQRVTLILKTPDGPANHIPAHKATLGLSLKGTGRLEVGVITKAPGVELELGSGTASLELNTTGNGTSLPAYSQLIYDVLQGDRSLFTSSDGLASAWAAMKPLLDNRPALQSYEQGTWGPEAAHELAEPVGWVLEQ